MFYTNLSFSIPFCHIIEYKLSIALENGHVSNTCTQPERTEEHLQRSILNSRDGFQRCCSMTNGSHYNSSGWADDGTYDGKHNVLSCSEGDAAPSYQVYSKLSIALESDHVSNTRAHNRKGQKSCKHILRALSSAFNRDAQ